MPSKPPPAEKRPYVKLTNQNFVTAYGTDAGRSGKNNEDNYAVFDARQEIPESDPPVELPARIMVVADGVGGASGGEMASQIAVDVFARQFGRDQHVTIQDRLENAIRTANREIYIRATDDPQYKGMGTTIVAAAIVGEKHLYVAHAGDSRAYLIRQGKIHLLTLDHTWAQEALDGGYLTLEQAKKHPNKNVIKRYLGPVDSVEVDHKVIDPDASTGDAVVKDGRILAEKNRIEIRPGDSLLLCSDGLTDVVSDEHIQAAINRFEPEKAVKELIKAANNAGGPDNITVTMLTKPAQKAAARTASPLSAGAASSATAPTEIAADTAYELHEKSDKLSWLPLISGLLLLLVLIGGGYGIWRSGLIGSFGPEDESVVDMTVTPDISSQNGSTQPSVVIGGGEVPEDDSLAISKPTGQEAASQDALDNAEEQATGNEDAPIEVAVMATNTQVISDSAEPGVDVGATGTISDTGAVAATKVETATPTNTIIETPSPTATQNSVAVVTATSAPIDTPILAPTSTPIYTPTPEPPTPTPSPTETLTPNATETEVAQQEATNTAREANAAATTAAQAVPPTSTQASIPPTPTNAPAEATPESGTEQQYGNGYEPTGNEVRLISPVDDFDFSQNTTFRWAINTQEGRTIETLMGLDSEYYFEPVVYDNSKTPKGMTGASKNRLAGIDPNTLQNARFDLTSGRTYQWTVLLVRCEGAPCHQGGAYIPIGEVAPRRTFKFSPSSSGGGGRPCVGLLC